MRELGYVLALAVLGAACRNDDSAAKAVARASASVAAGAAVPSARASSAQPPALAPACRALRVSGEAKLVESDERVEAGAIVDGSDWISLATGAKVTLKHTASGRELSLTGPAKFRACGQGREQVLLARGSLVAAAGMGSRPGAEVFVATPVAAVHYGDAELSLVLDDKQLSVSVRAGSVEIEPLPAPKKPVKSPLLAKDRLTLALGKPDAAKLVLACRAAAEQAEASARRVADASATEPLGQRAKAHVQARKAARASCTVAAAATGLVADPSASAGLWAEAARWEGLWQSIPRRGLRQAAEK
jgi:hypothetical protein